MVGEGGRMVGGGWKDGRGRVGGGGWRDGRGGTRG